MEEPEIDENLWIEVNDCDGIHYLIGNPHTFKGRIHAYCPVKKTMFCVSLKEISKMSREADYWIKGFLSGNEPEPPEELNDEISDEYYQSKKYKEWQNKLIVFRRTGELE